MAIDRSCIGKKYPTVVYEMGREKIKEYAHAIGDRNPLYHNEEYAKTTKYGDIIAPPTAVVLFARQTVGKVLLDGSLGLNLMMLVHGEQDFEFGAVMRPGDVITTETVIDDVYDKKGNDFMFVKTESKNQDGEVVVKATWTFVIRG